MEKYVKRGFRSAAGRSGDPDPGGRGGPPSLASRGPVLSCDECKGTGHVAPGQHSIDWEMVQDYANRKGLAGGECLNDVDCGGEWWLTIDGIKGTWFCAECGEPCPDCKGAGAFCDTELGQDSDPSQESTHHLVECECCEHRFCPECDEGCHVGSDTTPAVCSWCQYQEARQWLPRKTLDRQFPQYAKGVA